MQPIDRLWNQCWNARKFEVIDEIFCKNFVIHIGSMDFHGRDIAYKVLQSTVQAFPDIHQNLDISTHNNKDLVTTVWSGSGTHLGFYEQIAPTKKPFHYHGITIFRVKNGLIVEAWLSSNEAEQVRKLLKCS